MYSRRALVLACIALVLAQVESVKVPSSPTVVWKKRASTKMGSQNVLSSSPMTNTMTTVDTVTSSQAIADSIRYVGYIYIDADYLLLLLLLNRELFEQK